MTKIGLFSLLIFIFSAIDVDGILFKHLTPKPGGIIDSLTKPLQPEGFQLGSHLGGGLSFGVGSFGLNFGFNKQYGPGGPRGPHVPGRETGHPDGNPYVPGVKPGYPDGNPYVPGVKPGYPDGNPYVPGYPEGNPYVPGIKPVIPENPVVKPPKPGTTWEDREDEKASGYPPSKERPESYEEGKKYPKAGPYVDDSSPKREDSRPDWEDIGEVNDKDSKSENLMNSDLVGDGLLQPRLNQKRSRRFIESKIFHVPLLFQSNAKPSRVKISNSFNAMNKANLEK